MPTRLALARPLAAAVLAAAFAGCIPMATLPDEGPLRPSGLTFSLEPENSVAGAPISPGVAVTVLYNTGDTAFVSTATISLSIELGTGNPKARLHGDTVQAAVNGTAMFSNVSIDSAGAGYRLIASSNGLGAAQSDAFDVAHP